MKRFSRFVSTAVLATLASSASLLGVQAQTTFNVPGPVNFGASVGSPDNTIITVPETSTYLLGSQITFSSGSLTRVVSGTYASEARVHLTNSSLPGFFVNTSFVPGTSGYSGTIPITAGTRSFLSSSGYTAGTTQVTAGSTWSLEFFDSFEDGAGPDSTGSNLLFNTNVFVTTPPPASTNLGTLLPFTTETAPRNVTLGANEVKWYKFVLGGDATVAASKFLDIDTEYPNADISGRPDTLLGLYSAAGNLIASDDDDGAGNLSALSFGQKIPARTADGNGAGFNGRDGDLLAGTYYLAVTRYTIGMSDYFGASNFSVSGGGAGTSSPFDLHIRFSSVPEPGAYATFALAGISVMGFLRRRRK